MALKGNLRSFKLGEILQSLAIKRQTGTLCIFPLEENGRARYIHFADGRITFVSSSSTHGFRLGELLVRRKKATEEDIDAALAAQGETGQKLGTILVESGIVTADEIAEVLTFQLKEEFYDIFLLKHADFEFRPDEPPPFPKEALEREIKISIDPQPLIVEGMRRSEQWDEIRKRICTSNEVFARTDVPASNLEAADADIYALVDGRTPVRQFHLKILMGQFACARAISNLLKANHIRPCTVPELMQSAEQADDTRKHIFLQYAVELEPTNVHLRVMLADVYARQKDNNNALRVLHEGFAQLTHRGSAEAQELARCILRFNASDERAMRAAIDAACHLNEVDDAVRLTISLVGLLTRKGKLDEAKEALTSVNDLVPTTPELRNAIARKWESLGDPLPGVPHMEALAKEYEETKQWAKLSKILEWITRADPTRHDVKYRLNQLKLQLEREKKTHQRRKYLVVAAVALGVVPILYPIIEWYQEQFGVRPAYAAVQFEAAELVSSHKYDQAEKVYDSFLKTHAGSSYADSARKAIENLRKLKEEHEEKIRLEHRRELEQLERIRERPAIVLAKALEKERNGDLAAAHRLLRELRDRFPNAPQAKAATFPFFLMSHPTGATVVAKDGGAVLGRTPLKLRYKPGETMILTLQYPGCKDGTLRVTETTPWNPNVQLKWTPIARFNHPGPVHGELTALGTNVIFSSRDGYLYLLDPSGRTIRWRRKIGHYGDPITRFVLKEDKLYTGNLEGDFLCLNAASGQVLWRAQLPGPGYLAPSVRRSDDVYMATANGHVVRLRQGTITAHVVLDGCIRSGAVLNDHILVVGTSCDFCYGLHPQNLATVWRQPFNSDVIAGPILCGTTAALITADNRIHGIDAATGQHRWEATLPAAPASPPHPSGLQIFVPLENGEIHGFSDTGIQTCRGSAHGSPIGSIGSVGSLLFFGDSAGHLIIFDGARGAVNWSYESPGPVVARPCVVNGKLLFATVDGMFFFMEIVP